MKEKLDILRASLKNTVGIFNGDEPLLWNVRGLGDHKKYYYGIDNPDCDVVASGIQELEDGVRFHVSGFGHEFELFVPALGRHMVYNALAAAAVGLCWRSSRRRCKMSSPSSRIPACARRSTRKTA